MEYVKNKRLFAQLGVSVEIFRVNMFSKILKIKVLIALAGRLSLSQGWKMVLNGDLRLFHLTLNFL